MQVGTVDGKVANDIRIKPLKQGLKPNWKELIAKISFSVIKGMLRKLII